MKRTAVTLCLALCCLMNGCANHDKQGRPLTPEELEAIEKDLLLRLPPGTRVLAKHVAKRELEYGWHLWLLHFPEGVSDTTPSSEVLRMTKSPDTDVDGTVRLMKVYLPRGMHLSDPTRAELWEWESKLYEFCGYLSGTADGDYLIIGRFNQR